MRRKLLSLLLALALCLGLLPGAVLAAENTFDSIDSAAACLRERMIARESGFTIRLTLPYDSSFDLNETARELLYDALEATSDPHSGDYLAAHLLKWGWNASGSVSGETMTLDLTYDLTYSSTAAQEQQVDGAVAGVLAELGLSSSASDYERFRAAYDYICRHVTYDEAGRLNNTPGSHSAYAALVKGTAVCQGYSALLYRLLTELGVESRVVCGRGYTGSAWEDHAWNIVRIGGRYYFASATWDAARYPNYEYCLRGTGDIADHELKHIGASAQRNDLGAYSIAPAAYAAPVRTGWVKESGVWHFYDKSGTMVTNNWAKDGTYWCYMDQTGAAVTNKWQKADGKWYYFDKNGHAVCNGWARDGAYWCWMNGSGVAVTNKWVQADGHWYFFDGNGHAVCNGWARDGSYWCWMNGSGVAVTKKWVQADGHWYYFDGNGHAVCNGWAHDGIGWCWMDKNGVAVIDAWVDTDEGPVYFDADGHAA